MNKGFVFERIIWIELQDGLLQFTIWMRKTLQVWEHLVNSPHSLWKQGDGCFDYCQCQCNLFELVIFGKLPMNKENLTSVGTDVWSTSLRGNSPKFLRSRWMLWLLSNFVGIPVLATLMGHGLALAKVAQTTKVSCSKYAAQIHFYKERAGLPLPILKAIYV